MFVLSRCRVQREDLTEVTIPHCARGNRSRYRSGIRQPVAFECPEEERTISPIITVQTYRSAHTDAIIAATQFRADRIGLTSEANRIKGGIVIVPKSRPVVVVCAMLRNGCNRTRLAELGIVVDAID